MKVYQIRDVEGFLEKVRERIGLSVEEFAQILDLPAQAYRKILQDEGWNCPGQTLEIAKVIYTCMAYSLGEEQMEVLRKTLLEHGVSAAVSYTLEVLERREYRLPKSIVLNSTPEQVRLLKPDIPYGFIEKFLPDTSENRREVVYNMRRGFVYEETQQDFMHGILSATKPLSLFYVHADLGRLPPTSLVLRSEMDGVETYSLRTPYLHQKMSMVVLAAAYDDEDRICDYYMMSFYDTAYYGDIGRFFSEVHTPEEIVECFEEYMKKECHFFETIIPVVVPEEHHSLRWL